MASSSWVVGLCIPTLARMEGSAPKSGVLRSDAEIGGTYTPRYDSDTKPCCSSVKLPLEKDDGNYDRKVKADILREFGQP